MVAESSAVRNQPGSREHDIFLTTTILLLVVSVTLNVALARKLKSVRNFHSTRAAEGLLKVGATVRPITAKRLDGQQEVISYIDTNQPTVLYIFTPTCSWCARNMDNLKRLVDKQSNPYRIIGLSLSETGLTEYVSKNDLKLPIYSRLSPETLTSYKLGSTPQTIVISPEGKVLQDWVGAYVGEQKSQVEAFFHMSLPGLTPLPSPQATGNRASAESN